MNNRKLQILGLWLIASCAISIIANAQNSVDSEILRVWQDRLYFAVGTEARIYPGAEFILYCSDDSISSGRIEVSVSGLSYGQIDETDSILTDSCMAKITTASIDSLSSIQIGMMPTFARLGIDNSTDSLESKNNNVELIEYNDPAEIEYDLKEGLIDAVVSFVPIYGTEIVTSKPILAPFVAAILPNLSKPINNDGLLSTSLFYRCDDNRLALLFDGNNIKPFTHFGLGNDTTPRFYPFDPTKGRQLAKQIHQNFDQVSIFISAYELQTINSYFAGLLAIDRIRTTTTTDKKEADLQLLMVPINRDDSLLVIEKIALALDSMTVSNRHFSETLGLIKSNINDAREAKEHRLFRYYANHARHRLIEEIGAFTIFRPSIFISSSPAIQGLKVNSSGKIDLTVIEKLILPDTSEVSRDF